MVIIHLFSTQNSKKPQEIEKEKIPFAKQQTLSLSLGSWFHRIQFVFQGCPRKGRESKATAALIQKRLVNCHCFQQACPNLNIILDMMVTFVKDFPKN